MSRWESSYIPKKIRAKLGNEFYLPVAEFHRRLGMLVDGLAEKDANAACAPDWVSCCVSSGVDLFEFEAACEEDLELKTARSVVEALVVGVLKGRMVQQAFMSREARHTMEAMRTWAPELFRKDDGNNKLFALDSDDELARHAQTIRDAQVVATSDHNDMESVAERLVGVFDAVDDARWDRRDAEVPADGTD